MAALARMALAKEVAVRKSRKRQVLADQVDDAVAGEVGQHLTVHVDGGDAGIVRQGHAHDLAQGGHGGGGAHGLAGAGRAVDAALGFKKLGLIDEAGGQLLGKAPGVAGADRPAAEAAAEQRAGGDDDGRQVGAGGTHEQGRRGLVAADQQHHAVERVAADRFLDLHGGEVAKQHGVGPQRVLAQRHGGELERHPAGLPDAALHMVGELAQRGVAGVEVGPAVADADDRLAVELVVRQAELALHGAVHEAGLVQALEPGAGPQSPAFCHALSPVCRAPDNNRTGP